MNLLEVEDLWISFPFRGGTVRAVRGVSFTIAKGEIVGIVGESGCGKSVTAKSLNNLTPFENGKREKGTIRLDGQDLTSLKEKGWRKIRGKRISMIFQDPMTSLNPTIRVGLQIAEGYLLHHPHSRPEQTRQYVLSLLQKVGIPEPSRTIDEYPHTLSGGLRQRILIAMALACGPDLLIADEPTTALDVTIQAQILLLLKELQQELGMSILFITHDLGVVANFCDRVLVMYGGKIVESAAVAELFASPKHPYTQALLRSIPRLDMNPEEKLVAIEGSPPDLSQPIRGCSFCPRCPMKLPHCAALSPSLYETGEEHTTACHLYQQSPSHEERDVSPIASS